MVIKISFGSMNFIFEANTFSIKFLVVVFPFDPVKPTKRNL